ncbi:Uncharacterised protein [Mycobacteroides abscessus subsp. abscessus]|nr:Uncharacterised protein [Mycobacteroides abscessus subsp. abscessus]
MTSMAAVSSRMVRQPRSAVIAEPTAEASSMAATSEAACRTTARPLAAPASEVAPTWPANRANWMDSVTPMGSATNTVGITAVPAMNAACRTNSAHWKRPITRSATKYRRVCTARTNCSPTVVSAAIGWCRRYPAPRAPSVRIPLGIWPPTRTS